MRLLLAIASVALPWPLRRRLLGWLVGCELADDSRIGFSLVLPRESLILDAGARIGHLNVIWNLDRLHLGHEAKIGNLNWISAIRVGKDPIFDEYPGRESELVVGDFAGITQRHYLDCSDSIQIERFGLVGGLRSTLLTHHLDIHRGRQGCAPIRIGPYSLVSTNCVLLGGATLPERAVLGARSLLLDDPGPPLRLYVGSPAAPVKEYPEDLAWFQRTSIRTF